MTFFQKLAEQGYIQERDIQDILKMSEDNNKTVDVILRERGVPGKAILDAKSEHAGVPIRNIQDKKIPFEILKYVSEESATYYKFLPLAFINGVLEVGMVDPDNIEARDALQFISSRLRIPFKVFLISQKDFEVGVVSYHGLKGEVTEALTQFEEVGEDKDVLSTKIQKTKEDKGDDKSDTQGESQIKEDAPITKIVSVMLRHATEGSASDIHIEHMGDRVRVRFRVDGELFTSIFLPNNVHTAVVARIKILADCIFSILGVVITICDENITSKTFFVLVFIKTYTIDFNNFLYIFDDDFTKNLFRF